MAGFPGVMSSAQRTNINSFQTPLERLSDRDYLDDDASFAEKFAKGGLRVIGSIAESFNFLRPDIPARERAFRMANVATLFIPLGLAAKATQGIARAAPALKPLLGTLRGRVLMSAASEGGIAMGLEALRGDEDFSLFEAAAFGAGFGALSATVLGRMARGSRRVNSEGIGATMEGADNLAARMGDADYAILGPQLQGVSDQVNIGKLAVLTNTLDEAGFAPRHVKMADGLDGFLIPGMTQREALDLASTMGIPQVATRQGLFDLGTGTMAPLIRSDIAAGARAKPRGIHLVQQGNDWIPLSLRYNRTADAARRWEFEGLLGSKVRLFQGVVPEAPTRVLATNEINDVLSSVTAGTPPGRLRRLFHADSSGWLRKIYAKNVRGIFGVERVDDLLGLADDAAGNRISTLTQMSRNDWLGWSSSSLERGMRDFDDVTTSLTFVDDITGKEASSLKDIWGGVKPEEWQDFVNYGFARRFEHLGNRYGSDAIPISPDGRQLRTDDMKQLVKDAPDHFREAFDLTQKWQNEMLEQTLVRSEILTRQQADDIFRKSKDFIPLARDIERIAAQAGFGDEGAQILAQFDPLDRVAQVAGHHQLKPWTDQIVQRTYLFSRMATQRRATNRLIDAVTDADPFNQLGLLKKVDFIPPQIRKSIDNLAATMQDTDPDMALRLAEFGGAFYNVAAPENAFKQKAFMGRMVTGADGTPAMEWYEVLDELLWEGMGTMGANQHSLGVQLMAAPASALRAGATLSFDFLARNPVRDSAFTWITTGATPKDIGKGVASLFGQDEFAEMFFASGSARSALVSLDSRGMRLNIKKLHETGGFSNVVKNPFQMLRMTSEFMESMTRLGNYRKEFAKALQELGPEHAGQAARRAAMKARTGTVDFSVAGYGQAAQALRSISAFWNASMQGTDTFIRALAADPKRVVPRALLGITAPTVALYMLNRQDEEYQNLPDWERNLFWHVKLPPNMSPKEKWARIPKPFEPGLIFGSNIENMLRAIDQEDSSAFDDFMGKTLFDQIGAMTPHPTAAMPFFEIMMNRSLFTGRPLESRAVDELETEFRVGPGTSELAKWISQDLNADEIGLSPLEIDQILRDYTGGLGRMGSDLIDFAVETAEYADAAGGLGKSFGEHLDASELGDVPGFRGFMSRFPQAAASIEDFYRIEEKARQAQRTQAYAEKSLGIDDYRQWVEDHANLLGMADALREQKDKMSELRKQKYAIMDHPTMSPVNQQQLVEKIDRQIMEMTQTIVQRLKERGLSKGL